MSPPDGFAGLARHYDVIMSHVDYDRWYWVTTALADLVPRPFTHVDAACGTGVLLAMLRERGWHSFGFDLSHQMAGQARKRKPSCPVGVSDLRGLPLYGSVHYLTCLFDSVNFLLTEEDLRRAFRQFAGALAPDGVLYFDIVTERMVLEHFAGQSWTEKNGGFKTTWDCSYDRTTQISETRIRINNGPVCTILERMFDPKLVRDAVEDAGLSVLGVFNAESWRRPGKRTVRMDFVAVKGDARRHRKAFRDVRRTVRQFFV